MHDNKVIYSYLDSFYCVFNLFFLAFNCILILYFIIYVLLPSGAFNECMFITDKILANKHSVPSQCSDLARLFLFATITWSQWCVHVGFAC